MLARLVLDPGQRLLRVGLPVEGLVLLDRLAVRATAMRPQSSTALPTVETPDVLDLPGLFLVTGPERIAGSSASSDLAVGLGQHDSGGGSGVIADLAFEFLVGVAVTS